MKWENRESDEDETRVKTRFLLFPKTIGGVTRWLEMATWEEEYTYAYGGFEDGPSTFWEPIKWIK